MARVLLSILVLVLTITSTVLSMLSLGAHTTLQESNYKTLVDSIGNYNDNSLKYVWDASTSFNYSIKGDTLNNFLGVKLKIYLLAKLNSGKRSPGIISYNEVKGRLYHIVSFITRDAEARDVIDKLRYIGNAEKMGENFWVYEGTYRGHRVLIVIGDLGSFLIRIDDGKTGSYLACGESLNESLKVSHIVLHGRMTVRYHGQYGELTEMAKPGLVCNIINGTTVCSSPRNASIQKVLYNPYEVFYVYLDGFRIEPPIRVRCTYPEYTSGFSVIYMEGFAPVKIIDEEKAIITNEIINEIVKIFSEEGYKVDDPSEINVDDLYLTLSNESKLIPVFKLHYNNAVAWIGVDNRGVILLSFGVFTGSVEDNDGDQGLRIDWDDILSNIKSNETHHEGINGIRIFIISLTLVVPTILVMYLWKRKR